MNTYTESISREQIIEFCRRWKIQEFALFGSVLRENFHASSDIDALVTFLPNTTWSLLDHIQMENELQTLFGRDVDIINKRAVLASNNWIRRQEILKTAHILFSENEELYEAR